MLGHSAISHINLVFSQTQVLAIPIPERLLPDTCFRHFGSSGENSLVDECGRVGWGKMSMMGQSRSLEICICMLKINKPKVIRSTFLFSHWNRESRTSDPVTIS